MCNQLIIPLSIRSGSIIVDYRVSWDEDEDLSDDVLSNSLTKYLEENHGYIYRYFVPTDTLSYTKVLDTCSMRPDEMRYIRVNLHNYSNYTFNFIN